MKRFLVLMLAASMAAAHAFDYFSVGATFDPTFNYGTQSLYDNEDRADNEKPLKLRYNTISIGVNVGFGTIYHKDYYYKKAFEAIDNGELSKETLLKEPLYLSYFSDDYWFTNNAISIFYTQSGSGAINGLKFDTDDVKLRGFKITYDFSFSKKSAITDSFAFHFGVVPYSFAFSYLGGEYGEDDLTFINIEIWRFGFDLGAQYKINPQGYIQLNIKPMITFLESKFARDSFTYKSVKVEDARSRIYPNKNMFGRITLPITVSYVFHKGKPV